MMTLQSAHLASDMKIHLYSKGSVSYILNLVSVVARQTVIVLCRRDRLGGSPVGNRRMEKVQMGKWLVDL